MSLRPLGGVLVLVLADWALWTWSIGADQGILSLLAGVLMAPLFVALLWLATMTASTVVRAALKRLRRPPRQARDRAACQPQPGLVAPAAASEQEPRLAA